MKHSTLMFVLALIASALAGSLPAVVQADVEVTLSSDGKRLAARQLTAVITAVDHKAREVTLEGPMGNTISLSVGDDLARFEEFAVGDMVQASYAAGISGELRTPTAQELAEPWVELDDSSRAEADITPGASARRVVRAVCTIEGMNRATRSVTLLDSRGKYHVIHDIDAAKLASASIGDTVVITFSQAIALSLKKPEAPG